MSQNSQELPILEFSFSLSASSHNFDAHLRCDFWNKTYTYVDIFLLLFYIPVKTIFWKFHDDLMTSLFLYKNLHIFI